MAKQKKILAISTASYRGIPLYEVDDPLTNLKVAVFLGIDSPCHAFEKIENATAFIDLWYDLKKN